MQASKSYYEKVGGSEEESSNLKHLLPNEVEGFLNNFNDVGEDNVVSPPQNHDHNFNSLALDDIDLPTIILV